MILILAKYNHKCTQEINLLSSKLLVFSDNSKWRSKLFVKNEKKSMNLV